jgi:uncharacterized protein YegJ (DUF2314 family)
MRRGRIFWFTFAALLLIGLVISIFPRGSFRVKRVTEPSAQLTAAMSEARRRLPEFTRALANAKAGDRFAIRARFLADEEGTSGNEYLWLKDPIPSPKGFLALIDQPPILVKKKRGDLVLVPRDDIVDWLVKTTDGVTTGGFTNGLE